MMRGASSWSRGWLLSWMRKAGVCSSTRSYRAEQVRARADVDPSCMAWLMMSSSSAVGSSSSEGAGGGAAAAAGATAAVPPSFVTRQSLRRLPIAAGLQGC
ncbi:hypothetical protein V8C86DRAFT_2713942, partial [Haematococcus lacustris]